MPRDRTCWIARSCWCLVLFLSWLSIAPGPMAADQPRGTVELYEGFEAGFMPPSGWVLETTNVDHTWEITETDPQSGTYAAFVDRDPDPFDVQFEMLLSPELALSEATLVFWSRSDIYWCRSPLNNCELLVWIVLGELGGGDDLYVGKADDDWLETDVWSQSVFDITPLISGLGVPYRIGLEYVAWDERAAIAADEIQVLGIQVGVFSDGFESGDTSAWSDTMP